MTIRPNRGLLPTDDHALPDQVAGGFGPDGLALRRPADPCSTPDGGIALPETPPRVRVRLRSEANRYAARAESVAIRHVADHEGTHPVAGPLWRAAPAIAPKLDMEEADRCLGGDTGATPGEARRQTLRAGSPSYGSGGPGVLVGGGRVRADRSPGATGPVPGVARAGRGAAPCPPEAWARA